MTVSSRTAAFGGAVLLLVGCGVGGDAPSTEEVFVRESRTALADVLGDDAPTYTDEELVTYGERACSNLAELPDGDSLRRSIEAASVGVSDTETIQIAQATVLVTTAARHLCPDQGERLGMFGDQGAST